MLKPNNPGIKAICNMCGEELEADSFDELLDEMRKEGWKAIRPKEYDKGWEHYCDGCKDR